MRHKAKKVHSPYARQSNSARFESKFCLRGWATSHAGITNFACGVGNLRVRRWETPYATSQNITLKHTELCKDFFIAVRLIRPAPCIKSAPWLKRVQERPLRCQPRAAPWVYGAEVDFALKGHKICVLVLLPFQGEHFPNDLYPGRCPGLTSSCPFGASQAPANHILL